MDAWLLDDAFFQPKFHHPIVAQLPDPARGTPLSASPLHDAAQRVLVPVDP